MQNDGKYNEKGSVGETVFSYKGQNNYAACGYSD